ncbi:MAG: hypothetical protein JO024_03580 [Candidatus Eremiobacteraeota bacterium]|nr:hypothetical protein [Candidatus Eremiobacteraeota bacterium]MBV9737550.1 hypothetical protein [Candidatus Eremiobacteraeota bacterium]
MTDFEQLVLMPEVEARRVLQATGKPITLIVLRPVFPAAGRGQLRVLRARPVLRQAQDEEESELEVVAGYDSYERVEN